MKHIVRFYLSLVAWELFVLLVAMPVVARMLSGVPLAAQPEELEPAPGWYQLFSLVWFAMLSGWFWSIGTALSRRIKEDLRPGTGVFNLAVAFPVVYLLVITVQYGGQTEIEPTPANMAWIGLSFLLALASVGYTIRFVAKTLWMAEQQRELDFRKYGGTLFLLMFYPVALWFVHPRVRKVCAEE
jgi:hypothetical protein